MAIRGGRFLPIKIKISMKKKLNLVTPLTTSICPFRKRIFVDFLRKIYEWKMKNQWKVVTTFVDFIGFMVFKTTSRLTSFLSFWKQCTVAGRRLMANCCHSLNPKSPGGGGNHHPLSENCDFSRTEPSASTLVRISGLWSGSGLFWANWSDFCSKVRIFSKNKERTIEILNL